MYDLAGVRVLARTGLPAPLSGPLRTGETTVSAVLRREDDVLVVGGEDVHPGQVEDGAELVRRSLARWAVPRGATGEVPHRDLREGLRGGTR